jgi:hypothetical protein
MQEQDFTIPPVSIPAPQVNESRLQEKYFERNAQLQIHNVILIGLTLGAFTLGGFMVRAYQVNTKAVENFHPPVIMESTTGDARLIVAQGKNFTPDERVVRNALGTFVRNYFDRMRATVKDNYNESFIFLNDPLAQQIRAEDRSTKWLEKFLTDVQETESKVVVHNVVLKEINQSAEAGENGKAEIYCTRVRYSADLREQPHDPSDDFVVTAHWGIAEKVPNTVILSNPFGVLITFFRVDKAIQ